MYTNNTNYDTKLILPELSYLITGICFSVQNKYGRFLKEKRYCDLLEEGFSEKKIPYIREYAIAGGRDRIDFLIDQQIVVEVKAKRYILKSDFHQTQRYLQILNIKLALLINFRNRFLKPIRIVRIDTDRRKLFV